LFAGEVLEVRVDLLRRFGVLAIYGDEIIAGLYLKARLSERRAIRFPPIFAGVDLGDAIVAAVGLEIGGEQSHAHLRLLRMIAAADVGVRGAQFGD